jgi:hypothetical protein
LDGGETSDGEGSGEHDKQIHECARAREYGRGDDRVWRAQRFDSVKTKKKKKVGGVQKGEKSKVGKSLGNKRKCGNRKGLRGVALE